MQTKAGKRGEIKKNPEADHNTLLPFTRYLCGPADYTLCYFNSRVKNTKGHQLAMAAVYYSPLQFYFWYDNPLVDKGEQELQFWKDCPVVFDESIALDGQPGEYIIQARGMGDWAYNKLRPLSEQTRLKMIRNEFGGFNEAMYNLYSLTRDERYLWVARFFKAPLLFPLGGEVDLGTGHANTLIPKFLGECRNYELGNPQPSSDFPLPPGGETEGGRRAATLLYNTLTSDHAFVTGEVSDKEHLFKPETQSKHLTGYDGENSSDSRIR